MLEVFIFERNFVVGVSDMKYDYRKYTLFQKPMFHIFMWFIRPKLLYA